jgi:LmbE family N-acetylglucosaminyl deacetylase
LNILAIGPHPDDVELGCGGTLSRHAKMGDVVYIVHMSNGYHFIKSKNTLIRSAEQGRQEATEAAKILVERVPVILDFPPQYMECDEEVISTLDGLIAGLQIDTVYTVWENDTNQDHRAIHNATLAACRNVPNVYCYEAPRFMKITMLPFRPQKYVNITEYWGKKLAALQQYKTIMNYYGSDFLMQIKTRAKFRGLECGVELAEAFEVVREVLY